MHKDQPEIAHTLAEQLEANRKAQKAHEKKVKEQQAAEKKKEKKNA